MQKRSQIALCKLLLRYPFQFSSPRTASFLLPIQQFQTLHCRDLASLSSETSFLRISASNLHCVSYPTCSNALVHLIGSGNVGNYSTESDGSGLDVNKEVDTINLKFAEARDEIEMAMESKETVYFNEEAECARAAAKEVVDLFEGLLSKLPEKEKSALQRSMGLKIEQLKAELQQLDE